MAQSCNLWIRLGWDLWLKTTFHHKIVKRKAFLENMLWSPFLQNTHKIRDEKTHRCQHRWVQTAPTCWVSMPVWPVSGPHPASMECGKTPPAPTHPVSCPHRAILKHHMNPDLCWTWPGMHWTRLGHFQSEQQKQQVANEQERKRRGRTGFGCLFFFSFIKLHCSFWHKK